MSTLVPSSHSDILETNGFAFIATIGPGSAPHASPTWYLWDAASQQLLISLTTGRQKYRNLQRDPRLAACIPDPVDPYRHIEIRGRVATIEPDENRRFINTLTKKYVGVDEHSRDLPSDVRVVVRIRAESVRCFG